MRRAVLMTRQAISPRLAIRMRLNMLFLSLDLGRDPSLAVGAYGDGPCGSRGTSKSAGGNGLNPRPLAYQRKTETGPDGAGDPQLPLRLPRPWPRPGPGRE